jgi:hypothetical protein
MTPHALLVGGVTHSPSTPQQPSEQETLLQASVHDWPEQVCPELQVWHCAPDVPHASLVLPTTH